MNGTEWERERAVRQNGCVGRGHLYVLLQCEILVSMQKKFKLILCSVGEAKV